LTLTVTLVLLAISETNGGLAQPPGKKKGPPPFGKGPKGNPVELIVERIMAFDRDSDGKVTKEELPERLHHLIALGDTNKDGALDREEIRTLAQTVDAFIELSAGPGGPGGGPKGPKGGPNFKKAVDDLKLTGKAQDRVKGILKAHQDKIRRFEELAHAELLVQMKDVLSEADFRIFKAAVDRPPGPPQFDARPQDLERRIDQLQRELDALRGTLKK
jgi:hypothetical protein